MKFYIYVSFAVAAAVGVRGARPCGNTQKADCRFNPCCGPLLRCEDPGHCVWPCEKGGDWCPPNTPFCVDRDDKYNRGSCTAACEKGGYYCQSSDESCNQGRCCISKGGDCSRNPNCCPGTSCSVFTCS